jgi:hypothetical protein
VVEMVYVALRSTVQMQRALLSLGCVWAAHPVSCATQRGVHGGEVRVWGEEVRHLRARGVSLRQQRC